jgi:UDP:flavonoid glycosyltransferase YjiC (YdhE family)
MNITYAWELGGNLGHFAAAEPVLAQLHRAGHRISICSSQESAAQIKRAAFPHRWCSAPKRFTVPQTGTLLGHASIIRYIAGFHDEGNLRALLGNWRAILEEFGSDVVVCDFAPAAMAAAGTLDIPCVVYDTGFFYPPEGKPLPVLDPMRVADTDALRVEEHTVLSITNTCLTALGCPTLETFDALLRGQDALLVNDPTLDCFARHDISRFMGPVLRFRRPESLGLSNRDARPLTAVPTRLRLFAYLNRYSDALETVLDVLANHDDWTCTVFVGGMDDTIDLARWQRPHVSLTRDFSEFGRRITDLDVVLCHGGNGTINHALAHGVPLVLLPLFRENALNAERVREAGLGDYATGNLHSVLPGLLRRVGRDPAIRARAVAHAARVQPADVEALAARIVDCGTQHAARVVRNGKAARTQARCAAGVLDMSSLDVVFLSYDEPNADQHFLRLRESVAHAQRVHGVRGFAQARIEAARRARTDRFITVDADTVVDPSFFQLRADIPSTVAQSTLGWSSVNNVNGLAYGNWGVKVWLRDHMQHLLTHEDNDAEGATRYNFRCHAGYAQFNRCFSTTFPNGSPYQAFRTGFTEAVKLGRNGHGHFVPTNILLRRMGHVNLRRLIVWMSIGADSEHGLWCIMGSRMGFLANSKPDFDPGKISDFEWLHDTWLRACDGAMPSGMGAAALMSRITALGDEIRSRFDLMMLREWDAEHSSRFKTSLAERRHSWPLFDMSEIEL